MGAQGVPKKDQLETKTRPLEIFRPHGLCEYLFWMAVGGSWVLRRCPRRPNGTSRQGPWRYLGGMVRLNIFFWVAAGGPM